jgi:hypothetical protein
VSEAEAAKSVVVARVKSWLSGAQAAPVFGIPCALCGLKRAWPMSTITSVTVDHPLEHGLVADVYVEPAGVIDIRGDEATPSTKSVWDQCKTVRWWVELDAKATAQGRFAALRSSLVVDCSACAKRLTLRALDARTLAQYNAAACKFSATKSGTVVREPDNNVYGKLKVMRRTDSLLAIFDTKAQRGTGHVFADEKDARAYASYFGVRTQALLLVART